MHLKVNNKPPNWLAIKDEACLDAYLSLQDKEQMVTLFDDLLPQTWFLSALLTGCFSPLKGIRPDPLLHRQLCSHQNLQDASNIAVLHVTVLRHATQNMQTR